MKKIEIFYLSRMSQQQAFWFFKQIYHQMKKIEDKRFQPVLHSFASAFDVFDRSLKPDDGVLVEKIEAENANCNKEWNNLKELAEQTLLNNNQTEGKSFAKVVQKIIDDNDDPTTVSGSKKVDLLTKIFKDIEGKISVKDNTTTIFDTLCGLSRSCWIYKHYLETRNNELAGRYLTRQSLEARKRIELACYSAVEFLNAMFIYKGTERYDDIIDFINNIIIIGKSTPIIDIYASEENESFPA
jgi:hypothetical protein